MTRWKGNDPWGFLLGGAGVLLFRDQLFGSSSTDTAAAAAASTSKTATPVVTLNTKQLIAAAAANDSHLANGAMEFDRWNWYYRQIRGVAGPAIETVFPGLSRDYKMTLDEWWSGVAPKGLSGVSAVRTAWGY